MEWRTTRIAEKAHTMSSSALKSMMALRKEIADRLIQNVDYRALVALDKAIAEISTSSETASDDATPYPVRHRTRPERPVSSRTPSHADATAHLLEELGPMPTSAIVERIGDLGVVLSGNDPIINLSSSISKSGRFRSIRINSVPHWWFKDRELPQRRTIFEEAVAGDLDFGGSTDADTPAADDDNTNQEGGDHGDAAA